MGDAANGKVLFVRMCGMCHANSKEGKHKAGPNLFGIMGKTCGTAPGFNYTESMRQKGITWNETTMNEYLEFPKKFIPGTRMAFGGIKNAQDRKNVIAYLSTLK